MSSDPFSFSTSESRAVVNLRCWRPSFRSIGVLKIPFLIAFLFTGLMVYLLFLSPQNPFRPAWYISAQVDPYPGDLADLHESTIDPKLTLLPHPTAETTVPDDPSPPTSFPVSDVLTLEQIKDIVATTRGFFSRDYSLGLGWNNVSQLCYRVYISYK